MDQYSNRELDNHFGDIKTALERIEAQVIKTNGRVNSLENWRWLITGGLIVVTVLVIPVLLNIVNRNMEAKASAALIEQK